jgi:hypothetical protein
MIAAENVVDGAMIWTESSLFNVIVWGDLGVGMTMNEKIYIKNFGRLWKPSHSPDWTLKSRVYCEMLVLCDGARVHWIWARHRKACNV